jgi:hypothetical protein
MDAGDEVDRDSIAGLLLDLLYNSLGVGMSHFFSASYFPSTSPITTV